MNGEQIKQEAQQYSFSSGKEFSEELEDEKESRVETVLRREEKLSGNLRSGFYKMYSPDKPSYEGIAYLYTTAHHVLEGIIHDLEVSGEEELAEELRDVRQEMQEQVHPNDVEYELMRSQETFGHSTRRMKTIVKNHLHSMRSFAAWTFAGTSITTESSGSSSPRM